MKTFINIFCVMGFAYGIYLAVFVVAPALFLSIQ